MKISDFFTFLKEKKDDQKKEHIFGLILKEEKGVALIFEINLKEKTIELVGEKKFRYSNGWENLTEDIDFELSEMEETFNVKTEKMILFLYSHLVDQQKDAIKEPYLTKIKKMAKTLELKPLGYIENYEAIINFLKEKEVILPSIILVELDRSSLTVFIYKANQLIESRTVSRTEDLIFDVETGLKELKKDSILPTRLVIYGEEISDDEINKIITYQWDESLFIQIPKPEIFSYENLLAALTKTFSKEIFENVKDVEDKEEKTEVAQVVGFLIGGDIKETKDFGQKREIDQSKTNLRKDDYQIKQLPKKFLPPISFSLPKRLFLFIFSIILILFLFSVLFFFHHASITIYFPRRLLKEELNFAVAQNSINKQEIIIQKEETIETSGSKIIGEKARGEVIIYNSTSSEKNFSKGTILESDNGLKFSLDNDVNVASASQTLTADGNLLTVTGKTKTGVTALEIGSKYNLPKNQKLRIIDYPINSFFALVSESFSGGTEKKISTVSRNDIETIRKKTLEKIKDEAWKKYKKTFEGRELIDSLTKTEILEEKFSHELGEETKSLSFSTRAKVIFFYLEKDKLKRELLSLLNKNKIGDFQIVEKHITYQLKKIEDKDEHKIIYFSVEALTLPKINVEGLKKKIRGKSIEALEKIIKDDIKAVDFKVMTKENIYPLNKFIPLFEKNIYINFNSL